MEANKKVRKYVLFLLAVTYCFNFIDRQILTILQVPIKLEFGLSDTQLGLLTGFSFAVFYAALGIPIARLADRLNRVNIISGSMAIWSLMTALCGIAGSYVSLILFRIGVGVGEAGGTPPAHSIISDYFNKAERSRALALYSMGQLVGAAIGVLLGGFIAQHYGWRMAFFVVGIPGILIALIVKFTVPEPMRGAMDDKKEHAADTIGEGFGRSMMALFRNKTYFNVAFGHVVAVLVGHSLLSWLPPLLSRTYALSHTQVGGIIAAILILGGGFGMVAGGFFGDYLAKRYGLRWLALLPVIGVIVSLPLFVVALNVHSLLVTAICFTLGIIAYQLHYAPSLSLVQTSVTASKRALAVASLSLCANLIGLGLGPVIVGAISDYTGSLGLAMSTATVFILPAAFLYYRSARYIDFDEKVAASR
jgi:predicted MFS family arabinose efflux permease